jgi:radical SAM protein with 4Fe4S-binding SPASM domain
VKIAAVCSMLHETPETHSAARVFRGEAVLAWTLHRLARSQRITQRAVLCWQDQFPLVEPIAANLEAYCAVKPDRNSMPSLNGLTAAGRWCDGWRGGLLGACAFDRGFVGSWLSEIQKELAADAVLLVDPSSGLIDSGLIDGLIDHAIANPDLDFYFSPAAPGLSGVLIRPTLLAQLAAANLHPGALLAYRPDLPLRDPIANRSCVPIPAALARTTERFTLDSARQIERISVATEPLNGELISTEAEQLLQLISKTPRSPLPREAVLELNTGRATRPIYWPGKYLEINRPDLSIENAKEIFTQLAEADDIRMTFAGVGDPLLHPECLQIARLAHDAGITAIGIETDLVGIAPQLIDELMDSPIDVVSIFVPAMNARTYQNVMGIDGLKESVSNIRRMMELRKPTPIIVPTFVKTKENLAEMEGWYDHWLRSVDSAVILGPSDFAGLIPDVGVAAMDPPCRRACARLASRLTILSDGTLVTCEQDILARQPLGNISRDSIRSIWTKGMSAFQLDHAQGNWNRHSACAKCREWHRP